MALRVDAAPRVQMGEGLPTMGVPEKPYRLVRLTPENFALLSATNRVWKETISDRLGDSRSRKAESAERMGDFLEDRETYSKYNTVMGYMRKASEESLEDLTIIPYILVDRTSNVPQAMSAVQIKGDHVYFKGFDFRFLEYKDAWKSS